MPKSCEFIIPIICGNDWYDGFVTDVQGPVLEAARVFCETVLERKLRSFSVVGMSAQTWGYDSWMAPISVKRYDENSKRVADVFDSYGLVVGDGVRELEGIRLSDRIGHIHVDSKR